jgi:hypothetical protein
MPNIVMLYVLTGTDLITRSHKKHTPGAMTHAASKTSPTTADGTTTQFAMTHGQMAFRTQTPAPSALALAALGG